MPKGIYLHKKGYKRPPFTKEWKDKLSESGKKFFKDNPEKIMRGSKHPFYAIPEEKHPSWKGDEVGYQGVHIWMSKHFGKPTKCDHCDTEKAKRFEWANKTGLYLRQRNDWLRLCKKCHHVYDNISNRVWEIRKQNNIKISC